MRPVLLVFLALISLSASAQLQNNNWCFGKGAGITFNTMPPSAITSSFNIEEGVATVSNRHTGALMFYCSGNDIYNANGVIMPNGNDIGNDSWGTSSQGVVVVPFINDTNKYYIFTVSPMNTTGVLSYSVLDMTLDVGRGDIVLGQKRIIIDNGIGESMTVSEGCGRYWLITFKRNTQVFHTYLIDAGGVHTTAITSTPTGYTNRASGYGTMKVSPDRTKLGVAASYGFGGSGFAAVHEFNQATGVVGSGYIVDNSSQNGFYGCEFSPNSKLFYALSLSGFSIYQYDLTLPTVAQIRAMRKLIPNSIGFVCQLQLAPDSNIYVARYGASNLARISNANGVYPLCVYNSNAVQLITATTGLLGLPQAVVHPYTHYVDTVGIGQRKDTVVCPNTQLVFYGRSGKKWYQWQDNSRADSFIVTQPGTYWVKMPNSCYSFADTFVVSYLPDTISTRIDTAICDGDTLTLYGRVGQGGYKWQDGSTAGSFNTDTSGVFWVQMDNGCFSYADTFGVTTYTDSFYSAVDSLICGDVRIAIRPVADRKNNATYKWSTGEEVYGIFKEDEGTYWVTTTEYCAVTTDTIHVKEVPLLVDVSADTVICANDTILLVGTSAPATSYVSWSTGVKKHTTQVSLEGNYTFTASFSGCRASGKVLVSVFQSVNFELGSDTEVCRNDRYVLPRLSSIDSATFTWQDGSNDRKYIVEQSGRYTLVVNNRCGTFSDTVDISVRDCNLFFPSAFSPNGDGLNDIARFVGDLMNVNDFELRIYNRRGQEVFATTNVNDGWDGTHNGQPAAMATYYYFIKYTYMGEEHLMKGDVILVR